MQTLLVLPVRMGSARLPGKPLAMIAGETMLARVIRIAQAAACGRVLVAAAEAELAAAAQALGVEAVLTDPALPSGSDRVWAAAAGCPEALLVNVQADMPSLDPACIRQAVAMLHNDADLDIATLASPSDDKEDRANPNVVKAIVSFGQAGAPGRALYFSRSPIPHGPGPVLRHVGLYAYRREALRRFVAAKPSALEQREQLEQLRALELGLTIGVDLVEGFPKGVDTPADLAAMRAHFAGKGTAP